MNFRKETKGKLDCISLINSESRKCQTTPNGICYFIVIFHLFLSIYFPFVNLIFLIKDLKLIDPTLKEVSIS